TAGSRRPGHASPADARYAGWDAGTAARDASRTASRYTETSVTPSTARLRVLVTSALLVLLGAAGLAPAASKVDVVVTGLEVPWALAFAPDGRLFVTERPGRIRVVTDGRLEREAVATLPVQASSESGLMGLALDPDFAGG